MTDVVLATINAKYIHASVGLRYLAASLSAAPGAPSWELQEFTSRERSADIAERILALEPRVVGLGVYIWNAVQSLELVSILKRVQPDLKIVLGGPEVSYETDSQEIVDLADYVITGEGEVAFAQLVPRLLNGGGPLTKMIAGGLPDLQTLPLPYDLYTSEDIDHRVVYVEASRGCPFKCEFCLSALDEQVRVFNDAEFFGAMERLLQRGVSQFKFVDRTFNLKIESSRRILEFFWDRYRPGLFLHFEMIPDRLPDALREVIARFPPGALQFEVGVQTFNPEVAATIKRRQNLEKLRDNLTWLRDHTGVHVHADLIAGLPGEDLASFAAGFDRLVALRPQEIQLGILKRLRGAPIDRHDDRIVYSDRPPYEILRSDTLDFATLQRIKRMAMTWDVVANSGNFREITPLVWQGGSAFGSFLALADWLTEQAGRVHSLALDRLVGLLVRYLTNVRELPAAEINAAMTRDYTRSGRTKLPSAVREKKPAKRRVGPPPRQLRHI